ncbi:uncharacterized protein L969DRAFT_95203 [Mixia osmundae IAM 14324]|uniref:Pali-domain-containing protein n=1 Tax=Mixia osmundae (strain CBS 9802 / IAM 14324 / JCM 22182 / KY 12970) TaxID=764103 RepID=G7E6V5_MIXOS|nr:uncharacterized protein L969DRAFT_95203 [Mixia osmundae IAM 14324]KEI39053.1 hypothetical protein L969DRAFT_95203 [Mixia osmundae IAM 14324]GAA98565.1 hypothetical protein E5Q_05252 [Mixia osmundae IAM 14324]
MAGGFFFIGPFLLFAAMVLFVFISVSVPIWYKVRFLSAAVNANGTPSQFYLGLWGACVDITGGARQCSSKSFGYNINSYLTQFGVNGSLRNIYSHGLTYGFLLNPIAGLIALIALLFSIPAGTCAELMAILLTIFAFLVAAAALVIDLLVFIKTRNLINRSAPGTASLGNAIWLTVAATGALFLAIFFVCLGCFRGRSSRKYAYDEKDYAANYEPSSHMHDDQYEDTGNHVGAYESQPATSEYGGDRSVVGTSGSQYGGDDRLSTGAHHHHGNGSLAAPLHNQNAL